MDFSQAVGLEVGMQMAREVVVGPVVVAMAITVGPMDNLTPGVVVAVVTKTERVITAAPASSSSDTRFKDSANPTFSGVRYSPESRTRYKQKRNITR
jgi:hypothetical protein